MKGVKACRQEGLADHLNVNEGGVNVMHSRGGEMSCNYLESI